ncbi:hypothetical protein QFC22_003493 [Naganishia vaughanmartiniae]|uniref:Uncharacterized protein n=1 Tax=Naganishia vaughanmartiniae TaxID=1424756 RepID=A0ACC2X4Q9_9TREE|nr:hypothetical protein QFC22_003493 [Naganishia vaughanmartiniae]
MQEFVADQRPISSNFAHPMENSRKWGTTTPKLKNGMVRVQRHDRRQASAVFSPTATQSSTSASSTPTPGQVDTSVYKAGLGWTSDSGTQWNDFTRGSSSTVAKRDGGGTPLDQLDFVPMAWGTGSVDGFAADSSNFDAIGVSHLLSFNEPDQSLDVGGSGISPSDGAAYHQRIFNITMAAKYRIGSPAVARGSKWWMEVSGDESATECMFTNDLISILQQWVTACAGACAYANEVLVVDFVPLHFYGINADDMISYIEDFLVSFGKPVWVTETLDRTPPTYAL